MPYFFNRFAHGRRAGFLLYVVLVFAAILIGVVLLAPVRPG